MKRCDHLPVLDANPGKLRAVRALVRAFRRAAPGVAADQWRRLFETGRFAKNLPAAEEARIPALRQAKSALGAARAQMLRWQVTGQLEGFVENRANDFRDAVLGSSLSDDVRHQLLVVNRLRGWFTGGPDGTPIVMRGKKGAPDRLIEPEIRGLARAIMRNVLSRHRKPSWGGLQPWIDARAVTLGDTKEAHRAPLWLEVATLDRATTKSGKPGTAYATVALPVGDYPFWRARDAAGTRATTVQIIDRGVHTPGSGLLVGVVTDMEEAFAASRDAYMPLRDELTLDFGLVTMFATSDGDLLGRGWFDQLKRHDARINGLARTLQKQGIKPNRSRRYRARVAAFRGFLQTEISRVLNRIVALKRPARITIEKLDFTAPGLSKRLNRILARSGRKVVRDKLQDFEDRYGIAFSEVNPAYSSQTCSNPACGYVDKRNRKSQARFACRCCGHEIHADVNGARNLEGGRSAFDRTLRLSKADSLQLTVSRHLERLKARGRVTSADPHGRNRYFSGRLTHAGPETPLNRKPPDAVVDVSAG